MRLLQYTLALALTALVSVAGAQMSYEQAVQEIDRRQQEIRQELRKQLGRPSAHEGDAVTQFWLGVKYDIGEGVAKDEEEAVKWYRLAAEQVGKN